jgi:hypothetical protein
MSLKIRQSKHLCKIMQKDQLVSPVSNELLLDCKLKLSI